MRPLTTPTKPFDIPRTRNKSISIPSLPIPPLSPDWQDLSDEHPSPEYVEQLKHRERCYKAICEALIQAKYTDKPRSMSGGSNDTALSRQTSGPQDSRTNSLAAMGYSTAFDDCCYSPVLPLERLFAEAMNELKLADKPSSL